MTPKPGSKRDPSESHGGLLLDLSAKANENKCGMPEILKKKRKKRESKQGGGEGDEKKKSAALKRVSKRNRGMPALREERKNGCPSSSLLSHTLLKGRIKHFSELAATQSEGSDSKRLRRGGVTELTGKETATKGPGRLDSAGCLRKRRITERRETNG